MSRTGCKNVETVSLVLIGIDTFREISMGDKFVTQLRRTSLTNCCLFKQ